MTRSICILLTATALAGTVADACAAAQRTFVSGNGNDLNACSIAQPCRSFDRALTQSASGGEVVVLDSAGYGRVTIAKSIAIVAPPGIYAGISVFVGTNGIDVDGPGVKVALRGLSINGQGGNDGIKLTQGVDLIVDRCEISNMASNGIWVEAYLANVTITHTRIHHSGGSGIYAAGPMNLAVSDVVADYNYHGVFLRNGPQGTIRNTTVSHNTIYGFAAEATASITRMVLESVAAIAGGLPGPSGFAGIGFASQAGGYVDGNVARSTVTDNLASGIVVETNGGSGSARIEIRDTTVRTNHIYGIFQSGTNSTILLERNVISGNAAGGVGQNPNGAGILYSRTDNSILGNGNLQVDGTLTLLTGL